MMTITDYKRDTFGPFYLKGHMVRQIESRRQAASFIASLGPDERAARPWQDVAALMQRAWESRANELIAAQEFRAALHNAGWLDVSREMPWAQ